MPQMNERITVRDDFSGQKFSYDYKGGPIRRFETEENRRLYYLKRASYAQLLDFIEYLIEGKFISRNEEKPYCVELTIDTDIFKAAHTLPPIPEHLHQLLDGLIPQETPDATP